jgi:WhiB family redox-sensing transcriptional regulator
MARTEASPPDSWRQAAACEGSPSNVFYPENEFEMAAAKAICARCPVRNVCLETALRNNERYGVWGGLTPRERTRVRRRNLRDLRVA